MSAFAYPWYIVEYNFIFVLAIEGKIEAVRFEFHFDWVVDIFEGDVNAVVDLFMEGGISLHDHGCFCIIKVG